MRPSKFTDVEIRQAIAEVGAGMPLVKQCRTLGVTQTTFYRWRRKFGEGVEGTTHEARVLREENHKLKQVVADLYLERQLMRESLGKNPKRARRARA